MSKSKLRKEVLETQGPMHAGAVHAIALCAEQLDAYDHPTARALASKLRAAVEGDRSYRAPGDLQTVTQRKTDDPVGAPTMDTVTPRMREAMAIVTDLRKREVTDPEAFEAVRKGSRQVEAEYLAQASPAGFAAWQSARDERARRHAAAGV